LLPDFFLEEAGDGEQILEQMASQGGKPRDFAQANGGSNPELEKTIAAIGGLVTPELVQSVKGVFQFDLGGTKTTAY
jgi:hypothetical protein